MSTFRPALVRAFKPFDLKVLADGIYPIRAGC